MMLDFPVGESPVNKKKGKSLVYKVYERELKLVLVSLLFCDLFLHDIV